MVRDIEALLGFIAERSTMPFAYGRRRNDCIGYMLAAIEATTGRDALPGITWSTERGAARVIKRLGGLEAALDLRLRRIEPAFAMRGDVAGIVDRRFGVSVMIVEGATLVGPGARKTKRLPRDQMVAAWSIEGLLDG